MSGGHNDTYRYHYTAKSISDFLSPSIVGIDFCRSLYPCVREILETFFRVSAGYRRMFLAMGNGTGKTSISNLAVAYIIYLYCCTPHIRKQLGAKASEIVEIIILTDRNSTVLSRVWDKMLEDLKVMPIFVREVSRNKVRVEGSRIHYSCATIGDEDSLATFPYGLRISKANSYEKLQGKNILCAVGSEMSRFTLEGLMSYHDVENMLYGTIERMKSRSFDLDYLCRVIVDSTPYSVDESPLDDGIFGSKSLWEDSKNYIVTGASWEFETKSSLFPDYKRSGGTNTFACFIGDEELEPCVVDEADRQAYDSDRIIAAPIDCREDFQRSPLTWIRNIAGIPAGIKKRYGVTDEGIYRAFTSVISPLKDWYSYKEFAELDVIEEMIQCGVLERDREDVGMVSFVYKPYESRVIHADLSASKDMLGVACVHAERDSVDGVYHYVTDFMVNILPAGKEIQFTVVQGWIKLLVSMLTCDVYQCTSDGYEGKHFVQDMLAAGIRSHKVSVDVSVSYYDMYLFDFLASGRVHVPYNVVYANNLRSLIRVSRGKTGSSKIDHMPGDNYYFDSERDIKKGRAGLNAKDCTDANVGAVCELHRLLELGKIRCSSYYAGVGSIENVVRRDYVLGDEVCVG